MTTPHQTAGQAFGTAVGGQWGDVASFVGQGAYQVGSAAQNWGQEVTQAFVKALINGPAAALGTAFTSVEHFLEALGTWLATLPLEALQMFQAFIPGSVLADFATVASAVETIVNALGLNNVLMYLGDFEAWLTATFSIVEANALEALSEIQQLIDKILNALGIAGTGHLLAEVESALGAIPNVNVAGVLGPVDMGSSVQEIANSVARGLHQGELTVDAGLSQLTNWFGSFASHVGWSPVGSAPDPNSLSAITSGVATSLAERAISKPSYIGIDPTTDSVFPLYNLSGSTPTTVPCTPAHSVIGFIGTPDGGKKQSVCWLGSDVSGLTGFYINVYKGDPATGALTLIHSSPNYIDFVGSSLGWNFYDFPDPDDIIANQGDWYAVEIQVEGSGTYNVVGMPDHWIGSYPHPTAYPKSMAATRSAGAAPATIPSPTYSAQVPWFALCGIAGKSEHPPESVEFGPGTYTYTIPAWMQPGDKFDIAGVGGGAGGAGGGVGADGDGGNAGSWFYTTLTYGVDFPTTTHSFTVGAGGGGGGGAWEAFGSNGSASHVTITGYGTLTGAGGSTNNYYGDHRGRNASHVTLNGTTYYGGADQWAYSGRGNFPGGGGAGGIGWDIGSGFATAPGGGGAGGAVFITAYQSVENAESTPSAVVRPRIMHVTASIPTPVVRALIRVSAPTLQATASIPAPVVRARVAAPTLQAAASIPAPSVH